MEVDESFVKSEYSIEDLEQFRDENGFIDLTKAGIKFSDASREIIGNPDRVKNWVDFNGKKALIKGEAILEQERNYGIYAELITEEIAKRRGIPTAHYDLIKMVDEEGKEIYGVLSESIVDLDRGESLVSLHSIIGDEPIQEDDSFIDVTSLDYTMDKLREGLALDGYDEEQIEKVVGDYKKRSVFSLSVMDTDKHTENVAFIKKKVDGKDIIELSPNFDSESALMLDNDFTTVDKILGDIGALRHSVNFADPRIAVKSGECDSLWKDTLIELYKDNDVAKYCKEVLRKPIDMDEVLEAVEQRIHAELPENARLLAKYSYQARNAEMSKTMKMEDRKLEQSQYDFLMKMILGKGLDMGIRTGEQVNVGRTMEQDISKPKDIAREETTKTNEEIS